MQWRVQLYKCGSPDDSSPLSPFSSIQRVCSSAGNMLNSALFFLTGLLASAPVYSLPDLPSNSSATFTNPVLNAVGADPYARNSYSS